MVGFEPLLDAVEKLALRKNWARKNQGFVYGKILAKASSRLVTSCINKIYPNAVSQSDIEGIIKVLEELTTSGDLSNLSAFPRSEVSKLLQITEKAVKAAGRRLVLFIDRVEELPAPGIRLLQALVEKGIGNCAVVISANTESQSLSTRADMAELMNVLRRRGQGKYEVTGYSAKGLIELRWANGYYTSPEQAKAAYDFSLDGRIGLLTDWLGSEAPLLADLQGSADRLKAHFQIEYDRLTDEGRTLVKCLAAVFPNALTVQQAALCLQCSTGDLEQRLKPVLRVFAVLGSGQLVLRSLHVLYFVRSAVEPTFVGLARDELAAKLAAPAAVGQLQVQHSATIPLAVPLALLSMDVTSLLSHAKDDLRRGASSAAMNRIEAWKAWSPTLAPLDEAHLLRLEADALGQLGDYARAIAKLKEIPAHSIPPAEISIELGEKYLRSSEHALALSSFRDARRMAVYESDVAVWIKAMARTLSARNDTRVLPPSKLLVDVLENALKTSSQVADVVRCHALRSIARTLALIPGNEDEAIRQAQAAVNIAQSETKSIRDEGNSLYALADAYRHAAMHAKANDAYERAADIATRTGNYDLELYCLLGSSANAIQASNTTELEEKLIHLGKLSRSGSDEFVIYRLFAFVLQRLKLTPTRVDDATFVVSSRPWTRDLLNAAREDGPNRGGRIAAVRIIL